MTHSLVIALDGPSGSGKSSVAREVAKNLNILYVDTGAMFRALGYVADQKKLKFEEGPELDLFLKSIRFSYGESESALVQIDGENLTAKIREHHVSHLASAVSKLKSVRDFLLSFQRELAKKKACVMEGRDIGTVVFPDAFCKIFVTARLEVRAQRRLDQLKAQGQTHLSFESILLDVKDRDEKDTNRPIAPLKQADDAFYLDTTSLNQVQVIEEIRRIALKKAKDLGITL